MPLHRITELILKYHRHTLVPEEQEELQQWLAGSERRQQLFIELTDIKWLKEQLEQQDKYSEQKIWSKFEALVPEVLTSIPEPSIPLTKVRLLQRIGLRWAAAAAIFVLLGAGMLVYTRLHKTTANLAIPQVAHNILPGGNKAVLTLNSGQQIILDSAPKGQLTIQGTSQVSKTDNGKLSYAAIGPATGTAVLYNTLSTPRGGQYQVTLPDGTSVWLNSASSITFPTTFSENERLVKITGEAYFEVAHIISQKTFEKVPFVVEAGGTKVTVLGTHFNVNAYTDEDAVKTTLIAGAVKVSSGNISKMIRPGEQSRLNGKTNSYEIIHPDLEDVLAWKNGKFSFRNTDVRAIMRQISRWYDVDIRYKGNLSGIFFSGGISRKDNIDKLLELLELDGRIRCDIKGRELTVMPNEQ